jgi:hypothetical protein
MNPEPTQHKTGVLHTMSVEVLTAVWLTIQVF